MLKNFGKKVNLENLKKIVNKYIGQNQIKILNH